MSQTNAQPDHGGELETVAKNLATLVGETESARDTTMHTLAKGMTTAVDGLVGVIADMKKGTGNPGPAPTEASGKTDNEDDYDDEFQEQEKKPTGDMAAGYTDMRKGDYGSDEFVDATEFLGAMYEQNELLKRQNAALYKMAKGMRSELSELRNAFVNSQEANALVLANMAKGTVGLHALLTETPVVPASMADPVLAAKHRLLGPSLEAVVEAGGLNVVQMTKAHMNNIVSDTDLAYYKQHGEFPRTAEENAELVKTIQAL